MTPTMELRFVEREIDKQVGSGGRWYTEKHTVHILQQKWVEVRSNDMHWLTPPYEEWRDVPVVQEEK